MERQFKTIQWDGFHFGAVLTYEAQENTVAGTVWRFVMDRGQTLIVTPYPTPDKPAPVAHCVPERIEPILAACRFGWAVRYAAKVNINLEGHWTEEVRNGEKRPDLKSWGELINKAVKDGLDTWKARQGFPQTVKYDKARGEAHEKRNAAWKGAGLLQEDSEKWPGDYKEWEAARRKISKPFFALLKEIQESEAYEAEQIRLNEKRAEIETVHRKRIEKEKAAREKEITAEALEELRDMLAEHGAKQRGTKWLRELYDFIRQDVCGGNSMSPAIGAAGLQRVVSKVEELTGTDITESLLIECEPWRLAHESGAEGLERVRWVAVFEDGNRALIQNIQPDIHNLREAEWFEKVKPSDTERQVIEKQIFKQQAESRSKIMKQGKRFDLLNEYHCIRDKVGKCEYHITDGTAAHRALKAFAEKTDASNRLPAAKIRELMPNSSGLENKPKRWFECGIKPGKAAPDFMEEIFPALIKNGSGLWWIDLNGK